MGLGKWLLHKHEDLSLDPQHLCKKLGAAETCTHLAYPALGRQRRVGQLWLSEDSCSCFSLTIIWFQRWNSCWQTRKKAPIFLTHLVGPWNGFQKWATLCEWQEKWEYWRGFHRAAPKWPGYHELYTNNRTTVKLWVTLWTGHPRGSSAQPYRRPDLESTMWIPVLMTIDLCWHPQATEEVHVSSLTHLMKRPIEISHISTQ